MKILDFLDETTIITELKSVTKKEVIMELVALLVEARKIAPEEKKEVVKVILDREQLGSTGIGRGVAIPHGRTAAVKDLVAAFGISKKGVKFDALDGEPVYIIFLLVAPQDDTVTCLKALARISRLFRRQALREALREANSREEVIKIIQEEDKF